MRALTIQPFPDSLFSTPFTEAHHTTHHGCHPTQKGPHTPTPIPTSRHVPPSPSHLPQAQSPQKILLSWNPSITTPPPQHTI